MGGTTGGLGSCRPCAFLPVGTSVCCSGRSVDRSIDSTNHTQYLGRGSYAGPSDFPAHLVYLSKSVSVCINAPVQSDTTTPTT